MNANKGWRILCTSVCVRAFIYETEWWKVNWSCDMHAFLNYLTKFFILSFDTT